MFLTQNVALVTKWPWPLYVGKIFTLLHNTHKVYIFLPWTSLNTLPTQAFSHPPPSSDPHQPLPPLRGGGQHFDCPTLQGFTGEGNGTPPLKIRNDYKLNQHVPHTLTFFTSPASSYTPSPFRKKLPSLLSSFSASSHDLLSLLFYVCAGFYHWYK